MLYLSNIPLNFDAIFEFLGQFTIRCIHYFSKKVLILFRWNTKHANFGVGGAVPAEDMQGYIAKEPVWYVKIQDYQKRLHENCLVSSRDTSSRRFCKTIENKGNVSF